MTDQMKRNWHVYLARCADNSLYCGVTTDLDRRMKQHNAGTGAKYTRSRLPVQLELAVPFPSQSIACRVESAVKKKKAAQKISFLTRMENDYHHLISKKCGRGADLGNNRTCVYAGNAHREITAEEMAYIKQYQHKISKEEINQLPLNGFKGDIWMITNEEDAAKAVKEIREERILGFDTESRPAFRKGKYYLPSLIQIGTSEKVYIFHLTHTSFPEGLKQVFEDKSVIKAGVAVRDDVKDLQKISPFDDAGFIDLGAIALDLKLETHGLRNLAAKFLGFRISKAARCTNWANKKLTKAQINYAATDAWVSRELYLAMDAAGLIKFNGD